MASIAVIPDDIKRTLYVRECAKLMDIDEAVLKDATEKKLNKITYQQLEAAQKERERERRQREIAAQPPTQQPQAQPQPIMNDETAMAKRYRELESDLLKILINYGGEVLFDVKNDDVSDEKVTVSQYICKELNKDEIVFRDAVCKKVFDFYLSVIDKGMMPEESLFMQNHDVEISTFVVNLLMTKDEVCNKFWDKRNRYIPPEQGHLMEIINRTLYYYKFEIAQQEIKNIGKIIAQLQSEPDSDEEFSKQLSKLSVYQRYIVELGKELGIVMTRK